MNTLESKTKFFDKVVVVNTYTEGDIKAEINGEYRIAAVKVSKTGKKTIVVEDKFHERASFDVNGYAVGFWKGNRRAFGTMEEAEAFVAAANA